MKIETEKAKMCWHLVASTVQTPKNLPARKNPQLSSAALPVSNAGFVLYICNLQAQAEPS